MEGALRRTVNKDMANQTELSKNWEMNGNTTQEQNQEQITEEELDDALREIKLSKAPEWHGK